MRGAPSRTRLDAAKDCCLWRDGRPVRTRSRRKVRHPELSLLPYSLDDLLHKVRNRHFRDLDRPIHCWFSFEESLAFIQHSLAGGPAHIHFHSLLNHPGTPSEVLEFILTHEMLHLQIPGREIDGRWVDHPPEFWNRESELVPRKRSSWAWIYANFEECLKREPKLERLLVIRSRALPVLARPRIPLDDALKVFGMRPEAEEFFL